LKKNSSFWRTVFDLEKKEKKLKEYEKEIKKENFFEKNKDAGRIFQEYGKLKSEIEEFLKLKSQFFELKEIFGFKDISLFSEIEKKLKEIKEKIKEYQVKLKFKGKYDKNWVIMNFISGAGGDDAKDFCRMLFEIYQKFFERKNWKYEILKANWQEYSGKTKAKLLSEATILVKKDYAYGYLKNENGVHRLVRISPFSAKGLRHTSFVYVEILPYLKEVKESDIILDPGDIEIQTFRASGPGGQYVNRRETAVRVKYRPLGLAVECQTQRSQGQNKEMALKILKSKIYHLLEEQKKKEIKEIKGKIQIEWGHQIRSYILDPYHLVKDHRSGVEIKNIEDVFEGKIDKFLNF